MRIRQSLRHFKQLLAIALWLTFVGWAIWQHAQRSDQLPMYDAFTYYQKAHNVWSALHNGKNPLNAELTFRPPGTVLMSYPLGFHQDYRGFYFRSIFFPIALLTLAIVLAGLDPDASGHVSWLLVLFAAYMSTLPAYYYFEFSPGVPYYWGLVDFFLGGLAALAAACSVRGIFRLTLPWTAAGSVLSGLCVFIKPTGTLVLGITGSIWVALSLVRIGLLKPLPNEYRRALMWFWRSLLIHAIIGFLALFAAFGSAYLSQPNLAFGRGLLTVAESQLPRNWEIAREVIRTGVGYVFPVVVVLVAVFTIRRLTRSNPASNHSTLALLFGLAASSCAVFLFAVWSLIYGGGAPFQMRYCWPFLLMSTVYALPVVARVASHMPRREWLLVSMLMAAPTTNMALLLLQRDPSPGWQKWTGVNLSSGKTGALTAQAQSLLRKVQQDQASASLYSMSMSLADATFDAASQIAQLESPEKPVLTIRRPLDWQRPTAFRINEMLNADYWLFTPVHDSVAAKEALKRSSIDTLYEETPLFEAWATQLEESDGVAIVSDSPQSRVLRITDPDRLKRAVEAVITGRRWRSVFTDANPRQTWSEHDLTDELARHPAALQHVHFGDRFELRAVSVGKTGDETTLRVWWRPARTLEEHDWVLFIHSIDDKGRIVVNNAIPLPARYPPPRDPAIRFELIVLGRAPLDGSTRLALGFYRPDGSKLMADRGERDWNGMRVIIPKP